VISIRTSVVESGLYGDDYDAFAEALRAEGYAVELDDEPAEYRSAEKVAVEVGIWIWENAGNAAEVAALALVIQQAAAATISRAKKARRSQPMRRLPIYGPDGSVIASVELPADDDEASEG